MATEPRVNYATVYQAMDHLFHNTLDRSLTNDDYLEVLLEFIDPEARTNPHRERTPNMGEIIVRPDLDWKQGPISISISNHDDPTETVLTLKTWAENDGVANLGVAWSPSTTPPGHVPESWVSQGFVPWEELLRWLLWKQIDLALAW